MDKNKKKQKNIGPIKRYMENKVKKNTLEAIKRFRNKYHEEPSAEQKRKIYINEQKKLMRENKRKFNRLKLRIAAGALSISAFLAGMQFQKNQQLLPAGTSGNEITSEVPNEANKFKDSLKVDDKALHEAQVEETSELVNSLTTPDKLLTYIKSIYASEYNKSHDEQISAENVSFVKQILDFSLYEDTAENGDKIVRRSNESGKQYVGYNGSLLRVSVNKDGEKLLSEQVTYWDDEFVTVYSKNAEVAQRDDNSFTNDKELGYAISTGLSYYRALSEYTNSNGPSSYDYTQSCKQTFIDALVEHQEASHSNNTQNTQSNEISDNSER